MACDQEYWGSFWKSRRSMEHPNKRIPPGYRSAAGNADRRYFRKLRLQPALDLSLAVSPVREKFDRSLQRGGRNRWNLYRDSSIGNVDESPIFKMDFLEHPSYSSLHRPVRHGNRLDDQDRHEPRPKHPDQ